METTGQARFNVMRGVIETVDLVGREVQLSAQGQQVCFDVPVVCPIIMHDDRVRLRMLQPRDTVEVTYTWEGGQAVAQSIEVLSQVRAAVAVRGRLTFPELMS